MDLLERAKQQLAKQKLAEQTPKTTPVTKKPPKELKESKKPKMAPIGDKNSFKIDWVKVAQSSDFKRAVYLALEGKVFRGSNEKLDNELNNKIKHFRDPNFSGAVKEMKNMFKNGFIKPSDIIKEQEKIENEPNNTMVDI